MLKPMGPRACNKDMEIKGEEEEEEGEGESHNDTESCSRLRCLDVVCIQGQPDQPDAVRRMEQRMEQSVRLSCEGGLWRAQEEARQVKSSCQRRDWTAG